MKIYALREDRGFTLLEVIVVLMISSLITAILFQGLSLILDTRFRVINALTRIESVGLQESIVTTPLRGMLPDHKGELGVFAGDERRLKGLTLSPLYGTIGAPTAFAMTLDHNITEDETLLIYVEVGYDPVVIARWPGDIGAFSYLGRKGDWEKRWPPFSAAPDTIQVPRTVRLDTGSEIRPTHVVRVMGPHNRLVRLQDTPFASTE